MAERKVEYLIPKEKKQKSSVSEAQYLVSLQNLSERYYAEKLELDIAHKATMRYIEMALDYLDILAYKPYYHNSLPPDFYLVKSGLKRLLHDLGNKHYD